MLAESTLPWLFAAFWITLASYRGDHPSRFVAALVLGAAATHLGWSALHWPAVRAAPGVLLDASQGYTVLLFPLGPLLLAPGAASWRALPAGLAVARAGCIAAGCCAGAEAGWGAYPTRLAEIVLLLTLHAGLRRVSAGLAAPAFLAAFGALRLVLEPWRAPAPLGEPAVAAWALASFWLVAGLLWAGARSIMRSDGARRPALG